MLIGSDWTILNLGVRFRQSRASTWTSPNTLTQQFRVGFGLCSGTVHPFGSPHPRHFVGVRANLQSWERIGIRNWWTTGWQAFTGTASGNTIHQSGTTATLRVSEPEDSECSAWYLRFTKLGGGQMRLEAFLPEGLNAPDEFDFLVQEDRQIWKSSVNKHDTFAEFELETAVDENTLGALDTVNIFSDIPNYVSEQLRGIEWVSVRALRME